MIHNKIVLCVYLILKKYSSESKRLSKTEVSNLLNTEYSLICDRKTVSRALDLLGETVKDVEYTEALRGYGCRTYTVKTDWYIRKAFTKEETDLLAESIMKNADLSAKKRTELMDKLRDQGEASIDDFCISIPKGVAEGSRERENLSIAKSGIKKQRMLSFSMIELESEGKKRLKRDEVGKVIEYLVKPLDIVVAEGWFYLFGELGDRGLYSYFSLRRMYQPIITEIEFSAELNEEKSYIPTNRAEASFLTGGKRERILIALSKDAFGDFCDRFGGKIEIVREYGEKTEIAFECNINSLLPFLMQFGEAAEVISPSKLRRALAVTCKNTASKYLAAKQYHGHIN